MSNKTDAVSERSRISKNQIDEKTRVKSGSLVSNSFLKKEQSPLELVAFDSKSYKLKNFKSKALSKKSVSKG